MRATQDQTPRSPASRGARVRRWATVRAFTLLEMVVTVALLLVVVATLAEIFAISSDTTARTAAHVEVLSAGNAVRDTLTDQLHKMAPNLLIIESPAPTSPRSEVPGGPRLFRQRHDRLVFLAQGDVDEYQSFTDPTRGDPVTDPKRLTARSSQALVYFGPGIPITRKTIPLRAQPLADDADPLSLALTASEWVFLHRSILLMTDRDPNTDPTWIPPRLDPLTGSGAMFNGGPLFDDFRRGTMDTIYSLPADTHVASVAGIANLILGKSLSGDLLSNSPSIAALWEPSLAARSVSLNNPSNLDYYTRSGFTFLPHLADFRIEWTDGRRIDPLGPDGDPNTPDGDTRTRWFGLRPDPNFTVTGGFLDQIPSGGQQLNYVAVRRQDVIDYGNGVFADSTQEEIDVFRDKIEWSSPAGPAEDANYRAIWRADTWRFRPKALRFTYRVYDAARRLKNDVEIDLDEDGRPDPDGSQTPRVVARYGRQFSIVVALD
ncbi:MAG: hypothetical protein ACE5E1_01855 [Phycisphaerae bacterium]